jgi:hypothetical protein
MVNLKSHLRFTPRILEECKSFTLCNMAYDKCKHNIQFGRYQMHYFII